MRTWRAGVEHQCVRPIEARLQSWFDIATAVAAILTIPVVIGLAADPSDDVRLALDIVNWCCWAAFALELVTMAAISRDRSGWLRTRPLTPVLVVLTLPAFAGLDVLRTARLLRGPIARRLADGVTTTRGLRNIALLTLLTVGLGGFAFARMEPDVDAGDGLYWAVTTVTTTGYGDIVPTTEASKTLAMVLMLLGAAFVAILTGAIAQRFVGRWQTGGDADAGEAAGAGAVAAPAAESARDDAVLAKLDELGERLSALERAVARPPGGR